MSITDAIVVGEAWISEHYFTTDAKSQSFQAKVLERRKEWDAEAADGRSTVRSRFIEARPGLEIDLGSLGESSDPASASEAADLIHDRLLTVLGLDAHGLHLDRDGRVLYVSSPGITRAAPLVVILASPVSTIEELLAKDGPTLPVPVQLADSPDVSSAARLVSALFVTQDAPDLAVVLAGRWALLAERERWAEGRYLAIDLQLVCERNDTRRGGEIDRAMTCLASESIAPDADGELWWHAVLEESITHTIGVSEDLRDGVRLSIEILANEVVTRRQDKALTPLPADQAQPLAQQALRFLYRILFLLYAEASPELGVLPIGAPEYAQGYSLDRLRDLVQVELATPQARSGTHLYDSLGVLFRLVDSGHSPKRPGIDDLEQGDDGSAFGEGLTFNSLRADLFAPRATRHIDDVGLGNAALQQVLAHLLLSKETRGRDRGFISYAELGINQLGAVYEGLMSYTGFFATTDLYEVAKAGDASKGSWVVPVDRSEGISPDDFVRTSDLATGEEKPVLHERGTFVFRLAGRERQQSASYYTPEVLTRFTVAQALDELLDQDGVTPAADILTLTVCEPALGSGAFAIEAVRQLAAQYLQRRQRETGERIDPDEYSRRLQEVKAYLALHNVYGVDLNATAVELAEISLWLDTMVEGLDAPWFGLHLRRGNSLIGVRRAVFRRDQLTNKSYLGDVPRDVPLRTLADDLVAGTLGTGVAGSVHHFLLPAAGWGSAVEAKEVKELSPDGLAHVKAWRRTIQAKPNKAQTDALVDLGYRVESLWQIALQRLHIAEREIRRAIPVWGAQDLPSGGVVQREQIEVALADQNGAYQRLRRVMDAWCALWFWPLTDSQTMRTIDGLPVRIEPPTLQEWIDALQLLLGRHTGSARTVKGGNQTLAAGTSWDELGDFESIDLGFASAMPVASVLNQHPWLLVCEQVALEQGFFHWELDFAGAFAAGGFSLQVGNPPWVRPMVEIDALLAEGDPWWQLATKATEEARRNKRVETLSLAGIQQLVLQGVCDAAGTSAFVGARQQYPLLGGLQPDLYRCFMEQSWRHSATGGITGLIHPETHFTDEKAGGLRSETYLRIRRHWQFINALLLFDIKDNKRYGVHIYGAAKHEVDFASACWLYHPDTVTRSLVHDGTGPEPGLRDDEGNWDLRPHRNRIVRVTDETLALWHSVLEVEGVPVRSSRMVFAVNQSAAAVLDKVSRSPRISELGLGFSAGWHEKNDRTKGYFEPAWGGVAGWAEAILQGPHLHVLTPLYKSPNATMKHNQDWTATDFEWLPANALPVTAFKPLGDRARYDRDFGAWPLSEGSVPIRDHFRVAWRNMADNAGERTLMPAVIPPKAAHVDGVYAAGFPGQPNSPGVLLLAAFLGSLANDFSVRTTPKSNIRANVVNRLAIVEGNVLEPELLLRSARLNCVTQEYGPLWESAFSDAFRAGSWTGGLDYQGRKPLGAVQRQWTADTPLRIAADRRQAMLEIDALVAVLLGLSSDELCSIYRTHFGVLRGHDRRHYVFDINGRVVPNDLLSLWRRSPQRIPSESFTATNPAGKTYTYELPFVTLDREADMRIAHAHFERLLRERS